MVSLETVRMHGVISLFLASNFVWLGVLLTSVGAVQGFFWCRVLIVLAGLEVLFEYLLFPLHPGVKGYWPAFNNLTDITKGLQDYNHAEIVIEDAEGGYKKDKNYMLCYLPHSLYGIGLFSIRRYYLEQHNMVMLFTGADIIFRVPILRRLMTWWGCTGVSARALKKTLNLPHPHNVLMLMPDGIAGMFYGLEQEQVILQRRRGFCRVALQTGASLIPCYAFGANDLYDRKFGPTSWASKLSHKLHISLVYWTDYWGLPFGFFPKPTKLVFAIGKPIDVGQQTENPTPEQIDALHDQFIQAMRDLYQRHKVRMGKEWAQGRDRLYLESEPLPGGAGVNSSKKKNI